LPAALDIEVTDGASTAALLTGASAWLVAVQSATGKRPIVYTYPSFWKSTLGKTVQPVAIGGNDLDGRDLTRSGRTAGVAGGALALVNDFPAGGLGLVNGKREGGWVHVQQKVCNFFATRSALLILGRLTPK